MNYVAYLFVMFCAAVIVALFCANVTLDALGFEPAVIRDGAVFSAGFISAVMAASTLAKRLMR